MAQTDQQTGRAGSVSGIGMDRVVAGPTRRWRKLLPWAGGIALVVLAAAVYLTTNTNTFVVQGNRIVTAPVVAGKFEDYIPIRGRVTPLRTVYLDVIEGGQVQHKYVEDGALVEAGDLLVTLSNTSMQLDVTRNEAMVTEQLNNMRTIELQLEQNRLQHRRNLVEIDYQIQRLERQVHRLSDLDNAGVAAKSQLEDAQDELLYYRKRREVTLESQATDARLQETQLEFLRTASQQLQDNLALARANLEALNVRAPVSGKLSGLDVEIGQSIQRGGRLGQIDDPDNFKLRVAIDEFYLNRVDLGLQASFDRGDNYKLSVGKIYPQVTDGQFELDLLFDGEQPSDIRRGQTIQAELTLGDPADALMIPNGTFFQDTGGNWIFVVSDDGASAYKRPVRLGRRNTQYIEVLDGLSAGERVITSSYSPFKQMDALTIAKE